MEDFLKSNNIILFWNSPEISSKSFITEQLKKQSSKEKELIIITTDNKPELLIKELKIKKNQLSKIKTINLYEQLIKKKKIEEINKKLTKELKNINENTIICLNELSAIINSYEEESINLINKLKNIINKKKAKMITTFTEWPYNKGLLKKIAKIYEQKVYINKLNNKGIEKYVYTISTEKRIEHKPFELIKGQIKELNQNVIIIGPRKSGKTTLINELSNKKIKISQLSEQLKIEQGEIKQEDKIIKLYASTGESFKQTIKLTGNNATSILVLINNNKQETINKAKEMINYSKNKGFKVIAGVKKLNQELEQEIGTETVLLNNKIIRKLLN